MIKWENITPTEFEELCYILLEQNGFTNLEWYGKSGGDRGRDVMAQKVAELLGNTTELQTWLCQSKRYTDKKISKSDIAEALNSAREHQIDYFLLAISATLSADIKDWLNSIKRDYSFRIVLWEEIDLRREIKKYSRIISERFPNLLKQNEVVHFYEMNIVGRAYFCEEIDEVGFYILNDYGHERNIKWIQEFIDFIKTNDISFTE